MTTTGYGWDATSLDRLDQPVVVMLVDVCIGGCELDHSPLERVVIPQECRHHDPVPGAGVTAGKGPPARITICGEARRGQPRHVDRGLPVPKLAYIEIVHLTDKGPQAVPAEPVRFPSPAPHTKSFSPEGNSRSGLSISLPRAAWLIRGSASRAMAGLRVVGRGCRGGSVAPSRRAV